MTEIVHPRPLGIDSWESIDGTTWAVCEYYAILSMHKSQEEAEAAMETLKLEREERERAYARLDPRQTDMPL